LNYIYWRYPSQAELDQADEFDEQAKRLWEVASRAMQAAADARKGTAEGFYFLGVLQRENGDAACKDSFEQAIKLKPDYQDAHDELVSVLSAMGQTEPALQEQATADNLVHTTAAPMLRLTWLAIPQTRFKTARQALERAMQLNPADPRVAAYMGTLAESKEDPEQAMAWYRTAAALLEARGRIDGTSGARPATRGMLHPNEVALSAAINLKTARLLLDQKRPDEALELFRAITRIATSCTRRSRPPCCRMRRWIPTWSRRPITWRITWRGRIGGLANAFTRRSRCPKRSTKQRWRGRTSWRNRRPPIAEITSEKSRRAEPC
jgi:tetratricopeptide (TPR) repeat protein